MESPWDALYRQKGQVWNRETVSLPVGVLKGKRVLELGCGDGKTLAALVRQKPARIVAVDFSSEALKQARSRLGDVAQGVEFVKADVCDLPFGDEEFDVVVCYYVLNALLEKERTRVVREMKRVLVSGGVIIFEDFGVGDYRQVKGDEIEKNTLRKMDGITCHFFTLTELKSLFKGFRLKVEKRMSNPVKSKPELKRVVLNGQLSYK